MKSISRLLDKNIRLTHNNTNDIRDIINRRHWPNSPNYEHEDLLKLAERLYYYESQNSFKWHLKYVSCTSAKGLIVDYWNSGDEPGWAQKCLRQRGLLK